MKASLERYIWSFNSFTRFTGEMSFRVYKIIEMPDDVRQAYEDATTIRIATPMVQLEHK
jgi:hypothetical protein